MAKISNYLTNRGCIYGYIEIDFNFFLLYNIFKGIFQPVFFEIYRCIYIFVYIFNLGIKPWSVPLQVVVGLCRGQIFEAVGEIKFSPV